MHKNLKSANLDVSDDLTVALSDELNLDLKTIIAFRKHSAASNNTILTEH